MAAGGAGEAGVGRATSCEVAAGTTMLVVALLPTFLGGVRGCCTGHKKKNSRKHAAPM